MTPIPTNELLSAARARLEAAGAESPALDARLLLAEALGVDRPGLIRRRGDPVGAAACARFDELIDRRAAGEPVSRILGRREFWSLEFLISPQVLDPRPDSETVVESALATVRDHTAPLRLLDLGTGSGCLLLALLHEFENAHGVGVDRSEASAALAAENARRLGLSARTAFLVAEWGQAIDAPFDLIVANPPYIRTDDIDRLAPEVRLHDPRLALDGGLDGLAAYRDLAPALLSLLAPGGAVCLEIGLEQAAPVDAILAGHGFRVDTPARDLSGHPRCLVARHEEP
jgi:release factor glutamine methyltransferase